VSCLYPVVHGESDLSEEPAENPLAATIDHGFEPGDSAAPAPAEPEGVSLEAQRERAHLILRAASDHDFAYGRTAKVNIVAVDSLSNAPLGGVQVAVLFKSTADPRRVVLTQGETGQDGTFTSEAQLPAYNGGTSAVVITAHSDLGQSEIKHLVHR